jgi:hypothetical protein
MAIRSVSELLPRPFEELTLEDVPDLLVRTGEERETLFFERKAKVTSESLAKSCAAFANTMGGLLVIGVADTDDEVVGIAKSAVEAQVWVKDMLRGHLLPLPPFRARWMPIDPEEEGRGILLVLVAESSTTPHLLTRRGAIYVRNPGSSDPAPLADQRLLLELIARGERAEERATREALESAQATSPPALASWSFFAAVPTGVDPDHRARLFSPSGASRALRVLYDVYGDTPSRSQTFASAPKYSQHQVLFQRTVPEDFTTCFEVAVASHDGAVGVGHGYKADQSDGLVEETLVTQVKSALEAVRNFILDLGGHGDLRVAWYFKLPETRRIHFGKPGTTTGALDLVVERPATLEPDERLDHTLVAELVAEVARAGGVGPRDNELG